MTFGRSLTAVLAATLLLTACAGDDVPDTADPGVEQPVDDGAAAVDTRPATVALGFDGQRVPITRACNGVDGAVLATTGDGITISLVREQGTVLRYQGEGRTAETDEVQVEEVGASTIYRATLVPELPAVDIELELGDTSVLDDC